MVWRGVSHCFNMFVCLFIFSFCFILFSTRWRSSYLLVRSYYLFYLLDFFHFRWIILINWYINIDQDQDIGFNLCLFFRYYLLFITIFCTSRDNRMIYFYAIGTTPPPHIHSPLLSRVFPLFFWFYDIWSLSYIYLTCSPVHHLYQSYNQHFRPDYIFFILHI